LQWRRDPEFLVALDDQGAGKILPSEGNDDTSSGAARRGGKTVAARKSFAGQRSAEAVSRKIVAHFMHERRSAGEYVKGARDGDPDLE
jgi:hypothetical protein